MKKENAQFKVLNKVSLVICYPMTKTKKEKKMHSTTKKKWRFFDSQQEVSIIILSVNKSTGKISKASKSCLS